MRDWDNTTVDERRALVTEFLQKEAVGKIERVRENYASVSPGSDRGSLQALLMDTTLVWVTEDYGADHAAPCDKNIE